MVPGCDRRPLRFGDRRRRLCRQACGDDPSGQGAPGCGVPAPDGIAADPKSGCERVLTGDVCDPTVQQEALRDVKVVCHLAAYVRGPIDDIQEAIPCHRANSQTTLELALAASGRGIRRFVHFSTGNMYSPSNKPCMESDSVYPAGKAGGYFVSKLAADSTLAQICEHSAMEAVVLRTGTPYGPGEPSQKVIPTFLRLAARRQALRVVNGGNAGFNFVYIADVADCAVRAIEGGYPGIYNVASGEHTSLREMAQRSSEMFGGDVPLQVEPPQQGAFPGFPALSIDKARQAWRFTPRSLAAGLREYWASLAKEDLQS